MTEREAIEHIQRYTPAPGDVVILRTHRRLPQDVANRLHAMIREVLPDQTVMILESGMEIEVVERSD